MSARTKKVTESGERMVSVRFTPETFERLEAHKKRLQAQNPGFSVSQSDAVRDLVMRQLAAAESA